MKSIIFIFLLFIGSIFTSCLNCIEGDGSVIEEKRTLNEFNEIQINNSFNVLLNFQEPGKQNYILINAQENLIPYIETEVSSSELSINNKECFNTSNKLSADIFLSELKGLSLNGSGSIFCEDDINSKNLTISLNGSGDIEFNYSGETLEINHNGSGDIKITGKCNSIEIDSNGSGKIDLADLICSEVIVDSNGSGDVYVHSLKSAEIDLNGSGDVFIGGNPQNIKQESNGSGRINQINE